MHSICFHKATNLELIFKNVVYNEKNIFLRQVEAINHTEEVKDIKIDEIENKTTNVLQPYLDWIKKYYLDDIISILIYFTLFYYFILK